MRRRIPDGSFSRIQGEQPLPIFFFKFPYVVYFLEILLLFLFSNLRMFSLLCS